MINLFKRKKKAKKNIFEQGNFNIQDIKIDDERPFMTSVLYANYMTDIIYPACAACYGISEDKYTKYEERLEYIKRRVKTKHTSILEHSNVIVQAFIPLKNIDNLVSSVLNYNSNIEPELSDIDTTIQDIITLTTEVTDTCRYLTTDTEIIKDTNDVPIMKITIGGSIRGFRYIFENIENRKNKLFISIFRVLKNVVPSAFFIDFINDGVMDDYSIIDIDKRLSKNIPQRILNSIEDPKGYIDIINMDKLANISNLLKLDKEKCFDFISITVNFKNMSRIITQQLTRHRNGITQESQRYVNYSESPFNSPANFKDTYDKEKIYNTPIGDFNLKDLGYTMLSIYRYLVDQGVEKEDARGYLPQNVQCGKVFMTFNLRTLFIFLNLRLDQHAQAEIRKYAEILAELTTDYSNDLGLADMYLASAFYSEPLYKRIENNDLYNDIDEEV